MIHRQKQTDTCSALQTGSLLISTPVNLIYGVSRLLILVTHHSEAGTTGIILNRDLPGHKIYKYIDDGEPVELKYGGPDYLQNESYIVIYPSIKNGWKDSVYWSADIKDLMTILHFMADYNIRYSAYYGCLKWKPEELEYALSKGMWWLTNNYQVHTLFESGDTNWNNFAKQFGGYFAGLAESHLPVCYN